MQRAQTGSQISTPSARVKARDAIQDEHSQPYRLCADDA
jgi:hypothetical protein